MRALAVGRAPAASLAMSWLALEQFQEKCVTVFRPELCKNKYLEHDAEKIRGGFRFQVDST